MRNLKAFAVVATLVLADPAAAQVVTGGAGNTGVRAPAWTGGVRPDDRDPGPRPPRAGHTANPSNSPVPGTTPGVDIGGTQTSGPPGTGGTAGGPTISNR